MTTETAGPSIPSTWRAWTWAGSADPLALRLADVAAAPLAPGRMLVRNAAIGLNPVDWKVLGGDLVDWAPGKVPGVDGAGTVVAVADDVPADWIGTRVAYHTDLATPGSFAEYTPVAARAVLRVPDGVDLATAAGMPCPALTAWLAFDKLPLREGGRVLISGAGGAVGLYAVQFAAALGFQVDAMCHPRHWERLRALGAQACIEGPLDAASGWADAHAGRYFAVVDSVNADHAAQLAPALGANGHLVCIQGRAAAWPNAPFGRALSLHEVALGALHPHGSDDDWARLVKAGEAILRQIAAGRLATEALATAGFDALPAHLDALRLRAFSGKALVTLG
ncbi:alcohol dehydrogenase catalytic domain-containing protein [Burkholderia sp. Ac-20379]|uniref:alcohol dehydrogenase catalytic domain-containing protein n=1 Tax=Burkholderia sp. Ac-20379 TaxID=2703900 RepID=UPI001D3FA38B|nr:alcohol dehydrogenase catalytic domain-containing protein [Burkholderia sp. Ac-20379]MBN3723904.1 alcohol dehydrogenase [Burkholderia sp. Ac-20379]